ncbi:MAG TPA: serine/threonine-protein kinase [Vicinamibacterales bacterium]|nr:serine/threonine-protein kinase [Vicinamibacterales bacterium]
MSDRPRPEDLPTFAEGVTTPADAPTIAPDAPTISDTAVTFAEAMAVTDAALPARIGRYRIVRLIGEGGMGAVYEAEQDQPRRTVALKVIKPGLAGPELLRRFAQEAQALGRLQHPGIAQIYDAGTADTGFGSQPYFAMEFIRGASLREYADSRRLGLRERLELMVKICDAVHHAHQRGLIHRDLKPGNIIVDEAGQPKILDFGVARVTDSDTQVTLQTDVGQLVGTLNYMSPEQVLADPLDIDTRSDVYALGVILYELLSGRLPYQISKRLHEAMQTIREEDPSRLSTIDRRYRGDIETIAAKALEKDKTRRYSSAAELAADITRYLKDEPIVAQPPTARYQLEKFARRHKALVGGVAAVFVVLVAGVVVSTWQAIRASRAEYAAVQERDRAAAAGRAAVVQRDRATAAERSATSARDDAVAARGVAIAAEGQAKQERDRAVAEKQRADTESATAKAVSEFLQKNLFEQVTGGIDRAAAQDLSVSGALDRTAARIDGTFAGQPLVEAGVREAVGTAYMGLLLWDKAATQFDRAVAIRRRAQGDEDSDTLKALRRLVAIDANQRRWQPAEARMKQILEVQRRRSGPDHADTLQYTLDLAGIYLTWGKLEQAEPLAARAAEGRQRTLGPDHKDTIGALAIQVAIYAQEKKFADAQRVGEAAYASARRTLGEKDTLTIGLATTLQQIAVQARPADRAQRARVLTDVSKGLAETRATSLPEMVAIAAARATNAFQQNRLDEAIPPLLEAMEASRRAGQEELSLTSILAGIYALQGKLAEAQQTLAPIMARPDPNKDLMANVLPFALRNIGTRLRNDKRFAEAEPYLVKLVPLVVVTPGETSNQTRTDAFLLADVYAAQGKYAESERAFVPLLEMQRRVAGRESLAAFATQAHLGWTQLMQGRLADSEKTLREALDGMTRVSPDAWERANTTGMLGATLARQKRHAEAEPLLISGYDAMATGKAVNPNAASRMSREQVGEALLQLYRDTRNAAGVAEWERKLRN